MTLRLAVAAATVAALVVPVHVGAADAGSETRVQHILRTDSSAFVRAGNLAYREPRPTSPGRTVVSAAIYPLAQTFRLHSRPGSKRTIYLDFDGAVVRGTGWNEGQDAIPNGTYDRYDSDGNLASFSVGEHGYIQEVWREIAETYSIFDVDVTTQDPGPAAYNRNGAGDQTYGDHVLFTDDPTSQPVCPKNQGCGGVAFVGNFDDPKDPNGYFEPAWVRSYPSAFLAAAAASHEIGHTLGLEHDGKGGLVGSDYYSGQGIWTPIMGAGTNPVQQFSRGEYNGADNSQDDFAVMLQGGLSLVADEAGGTPATAKGLGSPAGFSYRARITTRSDVDYYRVGPCTAVPTFSAVNTGKGSALDLRLDLRSTSGTALRSSDPTSQAGNSLVPGDVTGMNAALTAPGRGSYLLQVDGVGSGNPATTGYSDYGSVGSYALRMTGCRAVTRPAAPKLAGASSGARGRPVNATARWFGSANGGSAITSYRVYASKIDSRGKVTRTYASRALGPSLRSYKFALPAGRYKFRVVAVNVKGASAYSGFSKAVTAR